MTCCQRVGLEQQFDRKTADRELRRFRRRGPNRSTQLLIDALRGEGIGGASLLDIGGGIGAIHHALLDDGASDAVHVDISAAYLHASQEESARRGHGDRVRFIHGDFVQLAPSLAPVDAVTLDRVICCYPDMQSLVGLAAEKSRRLFGAVYPPDAWWIRAGVSLVNAIMRLRRSDFRVYAHPVAAIDAVLRRNGFVRAALRRTVLWEIAVYSRSG